MSLSHPNGGYYLHTNGSLIHKTYLDPQDVADSDFVKQAWYNTTLAKGPEVFLAFLKEANKLGAKREEILRLGNHNKLEVWIPDWETQIFGEDRIPMTVVGNEELGAAARIGDKITCPKCGNKHPLEGGKNEAGMETSMLLFYRCQGQPYIAGVDGRLVDRFLQPK